MRVCALGAIGLLSGSLACIVEVNPNYDSDPSASEPVSDADVDAESDSEDTPLGRYEDEVLADDPLSYWRLDELDGVAVVDQQGRFEGRYVGAVSLGEAGVAGSTTAVGFAEGSHSIFDESLTLELGAEFSVEVWVYPESLQPLQQTLVSGRANLVGDGWVLQLSRSEVGFLVDASVVVNGLEAERWTHVVGTHDAEQTRLFVDGEEVAVQKNDGVTEAAAAPFSLGATDTSKRGLEGRLDEVAVYRYALSTRSVARHFAAGVQAPTL